MTHRIFRWLSDAHRFGSGYAGGVYWVDADRGLGTLVTQVSSAAGIEINGKVEDEEQVAQLWRELNGRGLPCLLILDNFPEKGALTPYLPTTGRVHSIVTTRRQDLGYTTVRLDTLSLEDSVRLLQSGERKLGDDAARLAERLGGLPLALELAKGFLNFRKDLSATALLEEMDAVGEIPALAAFTEEYRDHLPSGHERDVVRTFQAS